MHIITQAYWYVSRERLSGTLSAAVVVQSAVVCVSRPSDCEFTPGWRTSIDDTHLLHVAGTVSGELIIQSQAQTSQRCQQQENEKQTE